MTVTLSASIDVPELGKGVACHCAAFGLSKKSEPAPGAAVLHGLNVEPCLLGKSPGSTPAPNTLDRHRFGRHWTPVHVDFHVDDLHVALGRVESLGARREQVFEHADHATAAFCSDPFGHEVCLLLRARNQ